MPLAYYIVPFRKDIPTFPAWLAYSRTPDIFFQGLLSTQYAWLETRGNRAIVKVNATNVVLTALNALSGYVRLPVSALDNPLSSLSLAQKNAIKSELQSEGYTVQEVANAFPGDLGDYTLRDVFRFSLRHVHLFQSDGAGGIVETSEEVDNSPLLDVQVDSKVS